MIYGKLSYGKGTAKKPFLFLMTFSDVYLIVIQTKE